MSITPFFMFIINTYLTMNINKIKLSGTTYSIQDENACKVVELTQAQYDALPASAKTSNTLFVITDATAGDLTAIENRLSEDEEVTAAGLNALNDRLSEDEEVTAAGLNAVNDKFDGLKLMKISQTDYENLQVKDQNTLYIIVN